MSCQHLTKKRLILFAGFLASSELSLARAEPANLTTAKSAVEQYVDSGQYNSEVAEICREADKYLTARSHRNPGKLAVVFDLDETLFTNLSEIRGIDFGYQKKLWDAWVAEGISPPLPPVKELYQTAQKLGYRLILLSGRRESDRGGTEKNLLTDGYVGYATLVLMPNDRHGSIEAFKTEARAKLTQEGYVIVANIGDQATDLTGGYAEKTFKLPDPFYIVK